ncbi:histidine kinase, partial [Mycobacterium sp. ITM-2017-0098]
DMFETLSRRNRSLVDQQLSLIDRLERDEDDPERLESLFRLDHLAARMRRNGANLMVLAGAQISREQAESVPVTALVNAAASEVED